MDNIKLLAEEILINAAKSDDGHCYPRDIIARGDDINRSLALLEMYGTTSRPSESPMPLFTINEYGRFFAITGAWSGREKEKELAAERLKEQMSAQRINNRLVKWSIVITVVMGLLSILAAFLIAFYEKR